MTTQVAHFVAGVLFIVLDCFSGFHLSQLPARSTTSMYFSRLGKIGGAHSGLALRCETGHAGYDICAKYPVEMVECHMRPAASERECTPHWSHPDFAEDLVFQNHRISCANDKLLETCFLTYTLSYNEAGAKFFPFTLVLMRFAMEVALNCVFVASMVAVAALVAGMSRATFSGDSEKVVVTIQKPLSASAPAAEKKKEVGSASVAKKEETAAPEASNVATTQTKE